MTAQLNSGKSGSGPDLQHFQGTDANDYIGADAGADTLLGGKGDDTLYGAAGSDLLDGGDGADTAASYKFVDLAQGRAVGSDGLADTLVGIENATGTDGNDELLGSQVANRLEGHMGGDVVKGFGGDDVLYGGKGNDTLTGGAGNDVIDGESAWLTRDGGADVAVFSGQRSDYDISFDAATVTFTVRDRIAGRDGVDAVRQVESFRFADGSFTVQELAPDYDQALAALFPAPTYTPPLEPVHWDQPMPTATEWFVTTAGGGAVTSAMVMEAMPVALSVSAVFNASAPPEVEPPSIVGSRPWLIVD